MGRLILFISMLLFSQIIPKEIKLLGDESLSIPTLTGLGNLGLTNERVRQI